MFVIQLFLADYFFIEAEPVSRYFVPFRPVYFVPVIGISLLRMNRWNFIFPIYLFPWYKVATWCEENFQMSISSILQNLWILGYFDRVQISWTPVGQFQGEGRKFKMADVICWKHLCHSWHILEHIKVNCYKTIVIKG